MTHVPDHRPFPDVEGGTDPIGRFEGSLGERSAEVRDRLSAESFLPILPGARVL